MGLNVKKVNRVVISPLDPGTYTGVCIGVVDLGEQFNQRFNHYREEIMLTFEVVGETIERGNGPEPRWVSKNYTKSIGDRSNLYRDLSKWVGLTDDGEFDTSKLLGSGCLVSIALREKPDGNTVNAIDGVMALPKGVPAPKAQSDTFIFDMDDPATYKALETLPQFVKDKIEKSNTWIQKHSNAPAVMDIDDETSVDTETGEITHKNKPSF